MASRAPNIRLRDLVAESGLTYDGIARAVRVVAAEHSEQLSTNKSAVEHWISGTVPAGRTGSYLALVLSRSLRRPVMVEDIGLPAAEPGDDERVGLRLGSDPIQELTPVWKGDLDRRRFLSTSAYSVAVAALPLEHVGEIVRRTSRVVSGGTIGMAEVAAVRDMVQAMTDMDERHGGQHGRSALVQYLMSDVATLCRGRFANDEVRKQLLSAASRGVHLAGWKAYDAGEQGLAQRYYLQSYALAAESEIPGYDGFVLRTMAMQGLKLHRPEHCLALAETASAKARGRVDVRTEALFGVVHAHTLAKAGRRKEALSEVNAARARLSAETGDEPPFWALAWGPQQATVHSRAAKVFETLSDFKAASEQYALASATRPAAYARVVSLDLVAQAEMELKQGSIEAACAVWHRALDAMDGVRSVRTAKAVKSIRHQLSPFRVRGLRCARELDERARG